MMRPSFEVGEPRPEMAACVVPAADAACFSFGSPIRKKYNKN